MIDIKNYNFYEFNINDFINDWYIEYDWIYWKWIFKKIDNKIIIMFLNYDKNRINELFIYDKLKDWININYYDFYKVFDNNWKYELKKELKHIEKSIKIKENYNLKYDIYSSIYKHFIWYKYTINKLFDIKLYDWYIDFHNILFDKYHILKAIENIN